MKRGGVKRRILGIPFKYNNLVDSKIVWRKNTFNIDDTGSVMKRVPNSDSSNIDNIMLINIDFDFT